eukprot:9112480-Pyramimonas_sp.AAC.1
MAEREVHEAAGHVQFRAWCGDCVGGRGRNADHKRLEAEREHLVNTISIDYTFFGGDDERAEPTLVLREHKGRWT